MEGKGELLPQSTKRGSMPELVLPPDDGKMTPPPEGERKRAWDSEREVLMLRFFFFV